MMTRQPHTPAVALVERLIAQHPLPHGPDHACPYLPGRVARSEGFQADAMDPAVYAAFMDRGFRRSGRVIYRPVCDGCRACTPIRVPVRVFRMTRSQKRVWRRNLDLRVEVGRPEPTDERYDVYVRYLRDRHNGTMTGSREEFVDFLYDSPVDTLEFRYRLGRRLVGVSLVDRCPEVLSSVYMYFDPDDGCRGLGTYSILWEIFYARDRGMEYYYLGYRVAGCPRMSYKANFRPHELLGPDGTWISESEMTSGDDDFA
jgi:arginine-tRNA-protein transferase